MRGLNEAMSSLAQRFIFGSDDDTVAKWLHRSRSTRISPEPEQLGFITDPLARAHEFTWHRLAAALERDPSDGAPWDFALDWEKLAQGWAPMVFFPVNLLEFPPSLHRESDAIIAEFYDPDVYYALSRVREFEQMGDYDLLLEEATRGLDLAQDGNQKIRFLVARAAALDELEKYDEALEDYDAALEINSDSAIVLTNQATTLLKIGEIDQAIGNLERALSNDPNFGVARLNLGTIYYLRDDPSSAVLEITKAFESLPTGPSQGAAHLSRGNAHLMLGDHQKAIEDFAAAFSSYPNSRAKAFCEFRGAVALSESGDYEAALEVIKSSLALND